MVDRQHLRLGEAQKPSGSGPAHQPLERLPDLAVSTYVAHVGDVTRWLFSNTDAKDHVASDVPDLGGIDELDAGLLQFPSKANKRIVSAGSKLGCRDAESLPELACER